MRAPAILLFAVALAIAPSVIAATNVAQGVWLVPGRFISGEQPDGNTVVFEAPDGLVVVDTGRHPEHTREILDLAKQTGKPIRVVVNTHWHLDHIGGNALLRSEAPGVKVFATDAFANARVGFLADYRKQLEQTLAKTTDAEAQKPLRAEMALIDAAPQLGPDETISRGGRRSFAGRNLQVNLERRAATAADLWLYDGPTRVLVAGDLVTLPAPFLDTACPAGWRKAMDDLAKQDFDILIPGHGTPMNKTGFAMYRSAFDSFLDCAASNESKESCVDGWMAGVRPLLPRDDETFAKSITDYYVTLLRDPARADRWCKE